MRLPRVLFPEPLRPTTKVSRPASKCRSEGCSTRFSGFDGYAKLTWFLSTDVAYEERVYETYVIHPDVALTLRRPQPSRRLELIIVLVHQIRQGLACCHPLAQDEPLGSDCFNGLKRNQDGVKGGDRISRSQLTTLHEHDRQVETDYEYQDEPELNIAHPTAVVQDLTEVEPSRPLNRRDELKRFMVFTVVDLDDVDGSHRGVDMLGGLSELSFLGVDGWV